jgi:gamma-glutamylcyclotransferase (GGCT)/AIG2-like uncharacterized protein YtfP
MGERRRSTGSLEAERTTGSHDVVDRLFVYGTMRHGQTARSLIANQILRSEAAHVAGAIYAFPMGYPGFSDADGAEGVVHGELVWLAELPATFGLLDAYEGQDYVRIIKQVKTASGEQVWAWIYVLADASATEHGTLIADGDWVRYWTENQS